MSAKYKKHSKIENCKDGEAEETKNISQDLQLSRSSRNLKFKMPASPSFSIRKSDFRTLRLQFQV